jgi:hypothetical protein
MTFRDRIKETSITTGTSSYSLNGAVQGYKAFSSGQVYYCAATDFDFEVGIGHVGSGLLSRDTILDSSRDNEKVDWVEGIKTVLLATPAYWYNSTDSRFDTSDIYKSGNGILGGNLTVSGSASIYNNLSIQLSGIFGDNVISSGSVISRGIKFPINNNDYNIAAGIYMPSSGTVQITRGASNNLGALLAGQIIASGTLWCDSSITCTSHVRMGGSSPLTWAGRGKIRSTRDGMIEVITSAENHLSDFNAASITASGTLNVSGNINSPYLQNIIASVSGLGGGSSFEPRPHYQHLVSSGNIVSYASGIFGKDVFVSGDINCSSHINAGGFVTGGTFFVSNFMYGLNAGHIYNMSHRLSVDSYIGWSPGTATDAEADIAIKRLSVGSGQITNGSTGLGSLRLQNIEASGNVICYSNQIDFRNLPTADPGVPGRLYRTGGQVMVSL